MNCGKIRHLVREDLNKMYRSSGFFTAVLGIVIILFAGVIYIDGLTTTSYSLITIIRKQISKTQMKQAGVSFESIFLYGNTNYLWMFSPVVTAMPFIANMFSSKKNSNVRFEIIRTNKSRYTIGKMLAAMIAGGSIMVLGYSIFGIAVKCILPAVDEIEKQYLVEYMTESYIMKLIYKGIGVNGLIIVKMVEMFLYGAVSVVPAFVLSSIVRNKYLIICIPFMLNYFLVSYLDKQTEYTNQWKMALRTTNVNNIFCGEWSFMYKILIEWCVLIFAGLIFYRVVLGKRCDCGE